MKNNSRAAADCFLEISESVRSRAPLVHCLTNHISINQSANIVLAAGARPIMAEHPAEAAEITAKADALLINLGNISSARMKAMRRSGKIAALRKIPIVIDVCGIACSSLRLRFIRRFIRRFKPQIIKGNLSEIKTLCGLESDGSGVDVGRLDSQQDVNSRAEIALTLCEKYGCTVLITGKADVIAAGTLSASRAAAVFNGTEQMSRTTGTGCMLGALTAAYSTAVSPFKAAVAAAAAMGISGESAAEQSPGAGPAKTQAEIIDCLARLKADDILNSAEIETLY